MIKLEKLADLYVKHRKSWDKYELKIREAGVQLTMYEECHMNIEFDLMDLILNIHGVEENNDNFYNKIMDAYDEAIQENESNPCKTIQKYFCEKLVELFK